MPEPAAARRNDSQRTVLVLQGGGALGSYQAGVFEAMAEAGLQPDWVSGVSIGAINAAIIAGNPPERRVERLRRFWETITAASAIWPDIPVEGWRSFSRSVGAASAMMFGQPGFFRPRLPVEWINQQPPVSYYDTSQLHDTLHALVDFDLIAKGPTRLSVGAVNVETGNMLYFDSKETRLRAEHVMASGALPPGLAEVEIDGSYYWDGGLVSNTPLQYVMDHEPRERMLVFQIDLFPARGKLPENLDEVAEREKDIRYSSRTRAGTHSARLTHELRGKLSQFLERLPPDLRDDPVARYLRGFSCPTEMDIVHLIYRPPVPLGSTKDFEFSRATMERRWTQGRNDARATLAAHPWTERRDHEDSVRVFDVLATARR